MAVAKEKRAGTTSRRVLPERVTFDRMMAMTPEEMARRSYLVMSHYQELLNQANTLRNPVYRQLMTEVLTGPRMTFMSLYDTKEKREAARAKLVDHGYAPKSVSADDLFPANPMSPQGYLSAPSSHFDFYNAHPGGLCVTVALNCRIAEYYAHMYQDHFGIPVDREVPVACLCIHEYPKTWLYYWREDWTWPDDPLTIGDASWDAHDLYVTAELMHRKVDPLMVTAVAAAHDMGQLEAWMEGPRAVCKWSGYDEVVKFLHAGSLLAGVDPVEYGLLERTSGKLRLPPQPAEIWIGYLSDMNWPYTMGAAHRLTEPVIQEVAARDYTISERDMTGRPYNQFRSYVWSQIGQIPMYETLVREGKEAVRALIHAVVQPTAA